MTSVSFCIFYYPFVFYFFFFCHMADLCQSLFWLFLSLVFCFYVPVIFAFDVA